MLTGLLDNAAKYSPEGGDIAVAVAAREGGVEPTVRDRGIGLPPGAEERLFEPFERAPNALARNLPGLGIGLAISRGIVEQHGGRIRVESAGEGRGATATIWLPGAPPDDEERAPSAAGAGELRSEADPQAEAPCRRTRG